MRLRLPRMPYSYRVLTPAGSLISVICPAPVSYTHLPLHRTPSHTQAVRIRCRRAAETFRYDEEGNLSLHIDRDGRQLQRACNVFGQPVYEKASDAEGKHTNISTWHYDSLGRVTRAVCDGKSYEYIYDAHGNLKEKRSNGKRLVSYTHDRAGQITEIRDPEGVCTRYEYDILGRRSRIFNDDGLEVRYGYDALNLSLIHIWYRSFPTTCGISRLSKRIRLETGQSFPTNWTERSRISGDQGTISVPSVSYTHLDVYKRQQSF